MDLSEYLLALNPAQKMAVEHTGPSLLILAGAGSGKTRVITTKIAWLIKERHIDPASILAVTFTKKAASEMRERAILLEEKAKYANLKTFHSWGAAFLRRFSQEAGISSNFTVYDDDDMVTLVTRALPTLPRKEAGVLAHKISLAKDYGILPGDNPCAEDCLSHTELFDSVFMGQYEAYQKRLKQTGNVDFGDLILLPYLVLKNNESIRHYTHLRYRFVMVDEYQDSNVAQFLLLKELVGQNEEAGVTVCVVGDDDQSIYRFRGAEVQNILNFQTEFKDTEIVRLETNYRSTKEILSCASSVISRNNERLGKSICSFHKNGKTPTLIFLPNQDDETQFCADLIENQYKKGVPYSDWAILYRTNAQSMGFENDFLKRKIPYTVVGSLKFYEREEIKDALAWLAFLANPKDEIAFRRIVNKPARGIGNTTQDKISEAALALGGSIIEACKTYPLKKKAAQGMATFIAAYDSLREMLNTGGAKLSDFVEAMVEKSALGEYYTVQDEISGTQRVYNLQELTNSAIFYDCSEKGLLDFLDTIELDRSLEEKSDDDAEKDRVTLITLHNTKGLEFPRVIITGMEYGVFPREDKSGSELEEERRLFYVGITRAKNELYLTSCASRRLYGRTNDMRPSPFLSELGKENIRILGQSQNVVASSPNMELLKKWKKGRTVFHDDWGEGEIVHSDFTDDGEFVIKVRFSNGGTKIFMPQYQSSSLILAP